MSMTRSRLRLQMGKKPPSLLVYQLPRPNLDQSCLLKLPKQQQPSARFPRSAASLTLHRLCFSVFERCPTVTSAVRMRSSACCIYETGLGSWDNRGIYVQYLEKNVWNDAGEPINWSLILFRLTRAALWAIPKNTWSIYNVYWSKLGWP